MLVSQLVTGAVASLPCRYNPTPWPGSPLKHRIHAIWLPDLNALAAHWSFSSRTSAIAALKEQEPAPRVRSRDSAVLSGAYRERRGSCTVLLDQRGCPPVEPMLKCEPARSHTGASCELATIESRS